MTAPRETRGQEVNAADYPLVAKAPAPEQSRPTTCVHDTKRDDMDLREFNHAKADRAEIEAGAECSGTNPCEDVRVTLAFTVRDREILWDAAAAVGLSAPGASLSDVIDVIGPREDPSVADCIAMLARPAAMPGCELGGYGVDVVEAMHSPAPRASKAA